MHVVYVLGPSSQDRKWKSIEQKSFFKQNNFAFFYQYCPGKNIGYLVLNLDSQPETVVPGHIYFTFNAKKKKKSGLGGECVLHNHISTQLLQCVFFLTSLFSVSWHASLTKMYFQSGLRKNNGDVNVQTNTSPKIMNSSTTFLHLTL